MAAGYGVAQTNAVPVVSSTVGPTWATSLNAAVQELIDTKTAKITNTGCDFSAVAEPSHGSRIIQLGAALSEASAGTWNGGTSQYWSSAGGTDTVSFAVPCYVGERITAVSMTGRDGGTAWTMKLYKMTVATGVATQIGSTQTSGTGTAIAALTITGLTETIATGTYYYLLWTSGAASNRVYGCEVTADRA